MLYIAQAEVKPVIAKVDGEVKRLDGVDGQLQKQITEVKMSLDERLKLLHADLNAFKAQMREDLKRLATKDDLNRLIDEVGTLKNDLDNVKIKIVTPQQIRTIMREVLESIALDKSECVFVNPGHLIAPGYNRGRFFEEARVFICSNQNPHGRLESRRPHTIVAPPFTSSVTPVM